MIRIGNIQTLRIKRITKEGAFLNEDKKESDDILLPLNQLNRSMQAEDEVEVFVYRDSSDRLISTCKPVKITLGGIAVLEVVEVNPVGVFLDWGLEKHLLLPYNEQITKVAKGDQVLVAMYLDSTDRLAATMNVYDVLRTDSPYSENDRVSGTLYKIHPEHGAFVAVDNCFHGLVPTKELYGNYKEGTTVSLRVKKVHPDGRLELSFREAAVREMVGDSAKILTTLKANRGRLSLHDKSDPEDIKRALQMSKGAFKRAIGKLYKEGSILIHEDGIELIKSE